MTSDTSTRPAIRTEGLAKRDAPSAGPGPRSGGRGVPGGADRPVRTGSLEEGPGLFEGNRQKVLLIGGCLPGRPRSPVIWWTAATALAGLLMGIVAKAAGTTIVGSSVQQVFARLGSPGSGTATFLGIAFMIIAIVIAFEAAALLSAARAERSRRPPRPPALRRGEPLPVVHRQARRRDRGAGPQRCRRRGLIYAHCGGIVADRPAAIDSVPRGPSAGRQRMTRRKRPEHGGWP